MMNGEITQTSVFYGSSASPSTFTDLPTVWSEDDDNFLHHGANSDTTEHTPQCADSYLHTWDQEQVRSTHQSKTDVLQRILWLQHYLILPSFTHIKQLMLTEFLKFKVLFRI